MTELLKSDCRCEGMMLLPYNWKMSVFSQVARLPFWMWIKWSFWLGQACLSQGRGVTETAREEWMYLKMQWFVTVCILCPWEREICQCKQNYCFKSLVTFFFCNPFGTLLMHSLCATGWIGSWVHLVFKDINNLGLSATTSFGVIGASDLSRL